MMLTKEVDLGASSLELCAAVHDRPYCFFLDSALSTTGLGAFSFLGFDPFLVFSATGQNITLVHEGVREVKHGNPLDELRALLARYRAPSLPGVPFSGGAVGWFSYEFGLQLQEIKGRQADGDSPSDIELAFYDALVIFDHRNGRMLLAADPVNRTPAAERIAELEQVLLDALRRSRIARPAAVEAVAPPRATMSKNDYLRAIGRIKDYIAAGHTYQVNFSQRFEAPLSCSPWELYRRLRELSPAPFSTYLAFGSRQIASSSPERFLRIDGRYVETRPIKGTRRRGRDAVEDRCLREELLRSEKDRAELLMIVDLERNDLGRICEVGSIEVSELFRLETHPTVFHLTATVSGRLSAGADVCDCLRAMFPGGSITGAPKHRTMELIAEIEQRPRGVYTGALGYLGFDGSCDLNIAIRTVEFSRGHASYQVGGGIVWDSVPEAEYQETLDKGRAIFDALAGPQEGGILNG